MLSETTYLKVYRFSAWYDLHVTWPLAFAPTCLIFWNYILAPLADLLGLAALPDLDVHAVLFANFCGSVVIVWSLARLYLNDPRLGLFDGAARLLFSLAMITALMSGATPLLWGFLIPEIALGIVQILGKPGMRLSGRKL